MRVAVTKTASLLTLMLSVLLCGLLLGGCPGRTVPPRSPTSITCAEISAEQQAAISRIRAAYEADLAEYWSRSGFPPIARLADIRQALGLDPEAAFVGVLAYADAESLQLAFSRGALSPSLQERISLLHEALGDRWESILIALIREIVAESDKALGVSIPRGVTEPAAALLKEIYGLALTDLGPALYPRTGKACDPPEGTVLSDEAIEMCFLDCSDPGNKRDPICDVEDVVRDEPRPDDENTTTSTKWDDISTPGLWDTTYNPSCVGQGLGQCMAKLGEFDDECTCEDWNEFGREVGTEPGESGATISDQKAYVEGKGYCWTVATDGVYFPLINPDPESACEEAKAAMDRGCDVLIIWRTHEEMVTDITINASNERRCTLGTSSWGDAATVDYESGEAFNKSDKSKYGDKSSVQEEGADVKLVYICPC